MRKLLAATGILTIALSLFYVARPAGWIPPYDANLRRLAATEREGYCSGQTFWKTTGAGSAEIAAGCRDEHDELSDTPSMAVVEASWCEAIIEAGWNGEVGFCVDIMRDHQLWPTFDGELSAEWNRVNFYPRSIIAVPAGDDSRTGRRRAVERDPIQRGDAPTIIETPEAEGSPEASPSPEESP